MFFIDDEVNYIHNIIFIIETMNVVYFYETKKEHSRAKLLVQWSNLIGYLGQRTQ